MATHTNRRQRAGETGEVASGAQEREPLDLDELIGRTDDQTLHVWVLDGGVDAQRRGRARAELERRRRQWEEALAARRRDFEQKQMAYTEALSKGLENVKDVAQQQMAHANTIAARQDRTAARMTRATRFAAMAAALSALCAVAIAAIEVARYLLVK